jgi:putative hydrolase of the HAD superfamily
MILHGVRCVVFDVDDTLYLERDYVRSGFRALETWALRRLGVGGLAPVAWEIFESGGRGDVFDRALTRLGVEPEPALVGEAVQAYRTHRPTIRLLEDARDCLDRLLGHVVLAAITDGPEASQCAKVEALDLGRWCSRVVLTETLGCPKPHPRAFETLEAATGLRGDACVYVGDNPRKDFAGPKQCGWRTIRIRRVGGLHAGVEAAHCGTIAADHEIRSLASLVLPVEPGEA